MQFYFTTAQRLAARFGRVRRDRENFADRNEWAKLLKLAKNISTRITFDPASYDPTLNVYFDDGSHLVIANPRQSSYPGSAYVPFRELQNA